MMCTHLYVSVLRGSGLTFFCDHLRDINIVSLKQMNVIVIGEKAVPGDVCMLLVRFPEHMEQRMTSEG